MAEIINMNEIWRIWEGVLLIAGNGGGGDLQGFVKVAVRVEGVVGVGVAVPGGAGGGCADHGGCFDGFVQLLELQDRGLSVFAFAVHGDEFPVEFDLVVRIGGPCLDKIGKDVVESTDQDVELDICSLHVFPAKSNQRAFGIERVDDVPVHGQAFDLTPFEVQVIIAVFGRPVDGYFQADIDADLNVGQGVVVLVGGKAEHQGCPAFIGADQRFFTKYKISVGAGEAAIHKAGSNGERKEAAQGFDSCHEVGSAADRVDTAIADCGKSLGAEEVCFLEFPPGCCSDYSLQLLEADRQIDDCKCKVDEQEEGEDDQRQAPKGLGQHVVEDTVAPQIGHTFFPKVEGPVFIDKPAAVAFGVCAEAGIVVYS